MTTIVNLNNEIKEATERKIAVRQDQRQHTNIT